MPFPGVFHTNLRNSLREFHSFLSLPADTTMASSQTTQLPKMNNREANLAFTEACRSLPFRFLFFFSDNIMADVASKQQTTALFSFASHTQKKTHRTDKKPDKPDGETCAVPENIRFFVQFLRS
jgi:hypothetical protein